MENYLIMQEQKKQQLQDQYKKENYLFKNPLVVIDPFEVAPLTAVALWKDEVFQNYRMIIQGNSYEVCSAGVEHAVQIVGLRPGEINQVTIQAIKDGVVAAESLIEIAMNSLPEAYDPLQVKTLVGEKKSKNYIALNLAKTKGRAPRTNLCSILDDEGRVIWYYTQRGWNLFKQLRNNHMMMDAPTCIPGRERYIPTGFVEINLLGEVLKYYHVPGGLHHDVHEMPNGNFLVLTDAEGSVEDGVVEIDRQSGLVIKSYDLRTILDPQRRPGIDKEVVNGPLDWLHLNSVFYDETDDSIIVSSRNQNCVVKIDHRTEKIKWILGSHHHWGHEFSPYLLEPIGENFEWSWAQHSAFISDKGELLLFDNGNFRSYDLDKAKLAYTNYSRGVAYKVDEKQMTVRQTWQYGQERGSSLKCPYLGSISVQTNGNRLICFGGITKDRFGNPIDDLMTPLLKASAHLVEIQKETGEVVFEIVFKDNDPKTEDGFVCYRAEAIDLFSGINCYNLKYI